MGIQGCLGLSEDYRCYGNLSRKKPHGTATGSACARKARSPIQTLEVRKKGSWLLVNGLICLEGKLKPDTMETLPQNFLGVPAPGPA